ncbi:MAG: hypothetical protein RL215_3078 [Planctomycetota bacterium]
MWVGLEDRSADELDAPGNGGHDGLEAFADGAGLTGKVDDQ